MGPWDPNWRPDPTGHRLVAIRAARRGALAAAVIFGALEVLATVMAIPADSLLAPIALLIGLTVALVSLPALALLGAGLTSAALGTPSIGGERRPGDGCRGPGGGGHLGDDRSLHPRRRHGQFERWDGERSRRWRGSGVSALAGRRDGRGPDRSADRAGVCRLGPARSASRSAGADDRAAGRGPQPVVAQARTRTSSPRRMTPGRSTSPNTPNIRSLPSTWPRYSLIARSVS